MRRIALFLLVCCALTAACAAAPPKYPLDVAVTTQDPYNAFTRDEVLTPPMPFLIGINLKNLTEQPQGGQYALTIQDYWNTVLYKQPAQPFQVDVKGTFNAKLTYQPTALGAYDVIVSVTCGAQTWEQTRTIIVVPGPHPGLKPESFFASNTGLRTPELQQKIGLKVYRQHFADESTSVKDRSKLQLADPVEFDFTRQEKYVADCKKFDMSIVGIVGYANQNWGLSDAGHTYHMYGPPRDYDEFIRATVPVVEHFPEIKYWEFWNEPWIYGWTWASSSAEYRKFQQAWITAAKKARPDIKVLAGNSASFLVDNIGPDPACYRGLVDADTNHPYKEGERPNWRRGSQIRYSDYGFQEAERMGIKTHFITENGTEAGYFTGDRDAKMNAPKLVSLHVMEALAGAYQMNVQQGIGWDADQMRGCAAYGVMTHFLEDRVPVGDIWPSHALIWGGLFASPDCADPTLPRANVLKARWGVPGLPGDTTKVAVIWSYTGPDEDNIDTHGTLTIAPAAELQAYDMLGNPCGTRKGDSLTVPFGQYPVYLVSDRLPLKWMYEIIRDGKISGITPVNLYTYSLTAPVTEKPELTVRLQSEYNTALPATISLALPRKWATAETKQTIILQPGALTEVSFHLTAAQANADNLYPVTVHVSTAAGDTVRTQIVQVAQAAHATPAFTGKAADLAKLTPVRIDSDWFASGPNWSYLVLNPNLPRPKAVEKKPRVTAQAYTAWDKDNVYLAFTVKEPALKQSAGTPFRDPKYTNGDLGGVGFPLYSGDAIEFAFGINERAKDDYRKPTDPWYWKGCFRDTDYQYLTYQSEKGPQLVRVAKPGIPYRDGYQTEVPSGQGPVNGAKVSITREGDVSVYEITLPRAELPLLKPEEQRQIRFGFVVANDEGVGTSGRLQWSQAAGVFDYWFNNGSYQPTWESFWAAQTKWGLGK